MVRGGEEGRECSVQRRLQASPGAFQQAWRPVQQWAFAQDVHRRRDDANLQYINEQ